MYNKDKKKPKPPLPPRPMPGFPGGRGAATPGGFNPSVVTEDKKNQARGNAMMRRLGK